MSLQADLPRVACQEKFASTFLSNLCGLKNYVKWLDFSMAKYPKHFEFKVDTYLHIYRAMSAYFDSIISKSFQWFKLTYKNISKNIHLIFKNKIYFVLQICIFITFIKKKRNFEPNQAQFFRICGICDSILAANHNMQIVRSFVIL